MSGRARIAGLCALVIGAFVVDLVLRPGGIGITRDLDDLAQVLAAACAAAAAAWRSRRETGRRRLSWLLLAGGAGSWAVGQSVWTYYEIALNRPVPFPSLADVGFLMLPTLGIAAMLVRPSQAFLGRGRWRVGLDATLVVVSLFTVSWGTALGQVYRGGSGSLLARTVALAYPAGDLALLAIVVTVLSFAQIGGRSGVVCIGSGLAALAVADSGFAYMTAIGSYQTGDLIDAAWVSGFAILGFAAYVDRESQSTTRHSRTPHLTTLMPYVPAVIGIGFAMWQLAGSGDDRPLGVSTALLVVVLLVRQVVVVLENGDLAERMKHQAFHDVLTGLANRALFNDRLEHALQLRRRDRRQLTILLVDLDDFKIINDTLGHPAGDDVLVEVAARLHASARAGDTVARLGGDEFAILMEDGGSPRELARRVLDQLRPPICIGAHVVSVSGSIGIASLDAATEEPSATVVLRQADLAMYAAKHNGKGVARMYSPELDVVDSDEVDLRTALLADINSGNIDFELQPIYGTAGDLYAVEALARWSYHGESIRPATFLPIARDLDCGAALDEIVLRKAVATVAEFDDVTLTVNVDSRTLSGSGYAIQVAKVLHDCALAPSRLAVEVLELGLIENDQVALDTLQQLRQLGVRIVVDDFGAGYATLARLRTLRPDVLKIDRSLVIDSDADETAALLLESAVRLGQQIGALVIAEGIETESELAAAIDARCDAVQGYLLGRPFRPELLIDLLADRAEARSLPAS